MKKTKIMPANPDLASPNARLESLELENAALKERLATLLGSANQSSEERFRNLFEKMAQGVIYQNVEGNIISANPAAQRILGQSLDQMLGKTSTDSDWRSIHEDGSDFPGALHPAMQAIRTGKPVLDTSMGVYNPIHKATTWINVNAIPEFHPGDEKPYEVFVTINDITEQKLAEEALQASEERYRSLFTGMTEGFALHEIVCNELDVPVDYRFLVVNPAFEKLTGLKQEHIIGRLLSEVLPNDDPFWVDTYGAVALTGKPVHFEHFATSLNRYYEVYAFSPKIRQFAVLFMDITEQVKIKQELQKAREELEKRVQERTGELAFANHLLQEEVAERRRAEENLRKANTYNRRLIEASLDPQVTISAQGIIGDVNMATELATGCKREELIGTDFSRYFTNPARARAGIKIVFEQGSVLDYELEIHNKNDEIIPVIFNASVYHDDAGQVIGAFAIARNIAQRKKAEEQVRLQAAVLEAAANGIFITDRKGQILWCNPAFSRLSGYSMEELIGQNPRILKSGNQSAEFYRQIWGTISSGKFWQGELINRRKDGSDYYVEQTITPNVDDQGVVTNYIAIQQDISERKKAERKVQEQERLLSNVLENLPVGVQVTDVHGNPIQENPARKEIWKDVKYVKLRDPRSANDLVVSVSKWIDEEEWSAERISKPEEATINLEVEVDCLDGKRKVILYSRIPLYDEANRVSKLFSVYQDITKLKQIQRDLEKDRLRLIEISQAERDQRLFSESLTEATLVLNSSLKTDEVFTDILEQILHVIPLRAVNIGLLEQGKVRVVHHFGFENNPEALKAFQAEYPLSSYPLLEKVSQTRQPLLVSDIRKEPTWVTVPGMEWVSSYIVAPLMAGDRLIGFLNIFGSRIESFSPNTIKRLNVFANQATLAIMNARHYEELAKSLEGEKAIRKKLIQEEKFSAIGRMLASLSHEINSPLKTIHHSLSLIEKAYETDQPVQDYLQTAFSESARIEDLVAQMRELFQPRPESQKCSCLLSRLLEEASQSISEQLAKGKARWSQDPANTDIRVDCFPEQIKQVIINLSLNAIEAMQPDGGVITTSIVLSENGRLGGFIIHDTGPGISPEILPDIFEPFFSTKIKGLGLGLPISYDIIQNHNGQISVESNENQGTTFTVWLPVSGFETTETHGE